LVNRAKKFGVNPDFVVVVGSSVQEMPVPGLVNAVQCYPQICCLSGFGKKAGKPPAHAAWWLSQG
jgi:hypothetical protein